MSDGEHYVCGAKRRGRRAKGNTCQFHVPRQGARCWRHGGRTPNIVKFKPKNQEALTHGAYVAKAASRGILASLPLEVRNACQGVDVEHVTDDALQALLGYFLVMLERHERGDVSDDAFERGLLLYTDQITKIDLRRAQIRSSLVRAGLDDSTQRGINAGLELAQQLLALARPGARTRLESLPPQGNIDRRISGQKQD